MNIAILKEKNLVVPTYLISVAKQFSLGIDDFLLLVYFWNFKDLPFDVSVISNTLKLGENAILMSFNSLLSKKVIQLDTIKNENGKREEFVNLEFLYCTIDELFKEETKKEEKEDIFTIFEREMGRTISPMEYEIINAWLEKGFTEELILGALKEATYNGVNNLRYIDKVLYEWQRKGYKTMKDISKNRYVQNEKENIPVANDDILDYNWFDDNER